MIEVKVLEESGYQCAMLGLSLSYNKDQHEMPGVALKLVRRGGSHAKFLESIVVWLDIRAPRYWWQQFDTYRVGVTKQSESTMHTIMKRPFELSDFSGDAVNRASLEYLNYLLLQKDFQAIKEVLPEGFVQRRIVCLNYKVLAHMYGQRKNHRLGEWHDFFDALFDYQISWPLFVTEYGIGA